MSQLKSAQERWEERSGAPRVASMRSVFADDVVAIIYQPARSATISGKARTRKWTLRFEPRSSRYVEPLTGSIGNDDTLSRIELTFPSAEAAVAHARRQGLQYVIPGLADMDSNIRQMGDTKPAQCVSTSRPEWLERTLGPETIRKNAHRYVNPKDVLRDPSLSKAEKRDVLRCWALDAYLIESTSKGDAVLRHSRLDDAIDALIDLDEPEFRRLEAHASQLFHRGNSKAA
jgi:NADH dehydrogenase ubiquinone Fe-S protein 4